MRAETICQILLSSSLKRVHKTRRAAVWSAVTALLAGGVLALTGLGRACKGKGKEKNYIKKMDRLLGNAHLSCERELFYRAMASILLRPEVQPIIAVDWTPWRDGFHAITAGLAIGGRCIIFYGEVHPEKKLNNKNVNRGFLDALDRMLPTGCVPVLTTDGGFRTSWIDAVEAKSWDYVARVRGLVQYYDEDQQEWLPISELHKRATTKPRSLGEILVTKTNPRRRRIVVVRQRRVRGDNPKRKRVVRHKTPGADKRKGHNNNVSTTDEYYRKMAKEPWVLVTSMKIASARAIADIYSTRMQTEESYRGLKSHRFGWSFEDAGSTTCQRLNVLLMIGALASLAAIVVGWITETGGRHRDYQANTVRARRVLSWFYLGIRVITRGRDSLTEDDVARALQHFTFRSGAAAILGNTA